MKKFLGILAVIVMICVLILSGCSKSTPVPTTATAPTTAPTTAPSITQSPAASVVPAASAKKIKFGYTMPKGASIGAGFEWFATEFGKRTNGRYIVETYPSNTLAPVAGALDAVKSGAAEMMGTSAGTFPKNFPLSLVVSIPTLSFPGGILSSYSEGSAAIWDLINAIPEVKNEYNDYQLLWTYMLDPYNLVSKKKEIHVPDDLKGLKIGGSGAKMEMVVAAGGAKVAMAPPESYENLDKGIVDACFVTFSQVRDYKLYETANYYNKQDFGGGNYVILMNKDFWNTIPPEDQKILTDIWKEANMVSGESAMNGVNKGIEMVQQANKTIVTPTAEEAAAWEKSADAAIQSWMKDAKALGVSQELCDKVLAKWREVRAAHMANVK